MLILIAACEVIHFLALSSCASFLVQNRYHYYLTNRRCAESIHETRATYLCSDVVFDCSVAPITISSLSRFMSFGPLLQSH